jgi:hypothetical protein
MFARVLRVKFEVAVVVVLELLVLVGLRGERDGGRQGDAEVTHLVAVDIEDGYVNDNLRLGPVEIVEELLREKKLVRRGAHDDGVLAGNEGDLGAGIEKVADRGLNLVGIGLLGGVCEVEGLDGYRVEVRALGTGVLGDEDGVGGNRLVKSSGDSSDDAESVGPGDIVEIDRDALGAVVGIKENVETGGLADGLIDDLDIFDHVKGDEIVGDGLEFDGTGDLTKLT